MGCPKSLEDGHKAHPYIGFLRQHWIKAAYNGYRHTLGITANICYLRIHWVFPPILGYRRLFSKDFSILKYVILLRP